MEAVVIVGSILLAWVALLGTAYTTRYVVGLGRGPSIVFLAACYIAIVAGAVAVLGLTQEGALGAAGLLVPLVAAVVLVCRR